MKNFQFVKESSLIYQSGQWWKLKLVLILLFLTSIGVFAGIAMMFKCEPFFWLVFICIVLGICNLIFACVSIRCPVCSTHWVWLAISSKTPEGGLGWLMKRPTCPVCDQNENK